MNKRVLVILSGCGVRDGSEIQEATMALLALDRAGAEILCAAPNIPMSQCVDHFRGTVTQETRNVLCESARIARGHIVSLSQVNPEQVDAALIPGGMGAVSNLCNFSSGKAEVTVEPALKKLLLSLHEQRKPLGFICIAPVIAATLFGGEGLKYTLGDEPEMAARFAQNGAIHVKATPSEAVVDEKLKIVTTPAYMLAERISEIEVGITRLVSELLRMA